MRRLYVIPLLLLLFASLPARAQLYSDWWWDPDTSGQGINIGQQGNSVFMAWFTYDETGDGMWLVLGGALSGNVLDGDLVRTTGPKLGTPYVISDVTATVVGHGTVTFADPFDATFVWSVDGKSGTLPLVRETFGAQPLAGNFISPSYGTATAPCNLGNGIFAWKNAFTISEPPAPAPATFSDLQLNENDFASTLAGSLTRAGRWLRSQGISSGGEQAIVKGAAYSMDVLPIDTAAFISETEVAKTAGCTTTLESMGLQ